MIRPDEEPQEPLPIEERAHLPGRPGEGSEGVEDVEAVEAVEGDGPTDLEELDVDLDVAGEDFDVDAEGAEGDEGDEEGGEGQDGSPAETDSKAGEAAAKPTKRPRGSLDEVPEPGDPATKVPSLKTMIEALEWAFAGEDDITPELLEKFAEHARLILETNKVMNLTAIQDPKEMAAKHYLDSWRVTRLVPLMAKRVLDLGAGAGFPGLPIALAEPNLSMTLVESTRKKAEFLQRTIETMGVPNVKAIWTRAEDYLTTERVDVVVVRAVSSVRENIRILRKVRHSLKDMVMLKGTSWSREVRAGEREAERLGFKLDTVWEHELPEEMGGRAILVYRAPGGAGL